MTSIAPHPVTNYDIEEGDSLFTTAGTNGIERRWWHRMSKSEVFYLGCTALSLIPFFINVDFHVKNTTMDSAVLHPGVQMFYAGAVALTIPLALDLAMDLASDRPVHSLLSRIVLIISLLMNVLFITGIPTFSNGEIYLFLSATQRLIR
jgi:hypothetical protein